jgi:phage/plasmid-like protein (TIGR03299 family)
MAHEVEQMMYVGAKPWHGLGKAFVEAPSLEDAIVAAGLDWTVATEPVYTHFGEKLPALATRRSSDHSILGVVGPSYTPLQNSKAFDFFRPFIEAKEATIESAGSLRNGQRVFVLCKINRDPVVVKGNDTVEKYALLSNSHDGTLAVRVGFTGIRVVCANTLKLSHSSAASKLLRVRHTKNVAEGLDKIQEVMNLADQEFEATADQYRLLASKGLVTQDLETYVKKVFNIAEETDSRLMSKIVPLFEKGRGNDLPEIKGTYWAAMNAVSEYLQYERGKSADIRMDSLWFGQAAGILDRAQKVAVEMASAA